MTDKTDSAIAATVKVRGELSDLHSKYFRVMVNLGYTRVAVGEEHPTYWWSSTVLEDKPHLVHLEPTAIPCPFN